MPPLFLCLRILYLCSCWLDMNNKPTVRNTHQLLSIDPETRMGVCDRCGHTKIMKCGKTEDTQYWGCSYANSRLDVNGDPRVDTLEGKRENKTTARNGHTLSSFSIEDQSGHCDRCGPTTIVKCGKNPGTQYWGCAFAYPRKTAAVNLHRHQLSEINPDDRSAVCSQCGPTQVIKNGGGWICRYSTSNPKGVLDVENYRRHQLSEINPDTKRAVCANCGPVDISSSGTRDGERRWKCQFAHRVRPKSVDRPKKHCLISIDPSKKKGVCRECGVVEIVNYPTQKGCPWRCFNSRRWAPILRKYGLSQEDYEKMYREQDGKCAICKDPHEVLSVDHHHTSGKVRELLCPQCNLMLGNGRDVAHILLAGADYIQRHSVQDSTSPSLS